MLLPSTFLYLQPSIMQFMAKLILALQFVIPSYLDKITNTVLHVNLKRKPIAVSKTNPFLKTSLTDLYNVLKNHISVPKSFMNYKTGALICSKLLLNECFQHYLRTILI